MRQIITKAGAANIPPWYDAGKVWLQEHPAFPFGVPSPLTLHVHAILDLSGACQMRHKKQPSRAHKVVAGASMHQIILPWLCAPGQRA